jgi:hypothetical protein
MTLAMSGATPQDSGLASGFVNTTVQVGGAVGLAVLASIADSRSEVLLASGDASSVALNSGYHAAFLVGALFVIASAVVGGTLLRVERPEAQAHGVGEPALAEADH